MKHLSWFILLTICLILLKIMPVQAQTDTALRSEVYSLKNRVERLETEIRRLAQMKIDNTPTPAATPRNNPQIIDGELVGQSDPLFERLATLVIELKERVTKLEQQLADKK